MANRSSIRQQTALLLTWLCLGSQSLLAAPPLREVIDSQIQSAWEHEKITPTGPASDAEFLRRVSLDIVGVIPTHDETVAFLADPSPDKRRQLIDRLLDDPRYARHMAELWDVLLFTRNPPGSEADKRDGIQTWLRQRFTDNTPYDKLVRDLLKAEGNSVEQGPPLYFVQYRQRPEDMTEAITQTFLGVQLQCARCHNHPFELWTQQDFYGMAAFLARLQIVSAGKADNQTKYMVAEKSTGDNFWSPPRRSTNRRSPTDSKRLRSSRRTSRPPHRCSRARISLPSGSLARTTRTSRERRRIESGRCFSAADSCIRSTISVTRTSQVIRN
ncbi:MAG: hypothetical protein FD138_2627 [Planctomycetota bacterium]|nr:MAG: hypothetical protein FD138_2627 [Planctomycetota bacterium]